MKKTLLTLCAGVALCASAEVYEKGSAFTYAFGPDFQYFDGKDAIAEKNENWPTSMMAYGCSFGEVGRAYGTAAIWFNSAANQPTTVEAAAQVCPVTPDPWNPGDYALKMQAPDWWGYGNFNFALPITDNELCRVRVIYRVDVEGYAEFSAANGILVRLTDTALQGASEGEPGPNSEQTIASFWENTGYRVVDYYTDQLDGKPYLAITFMPGGFSCGGNKPAFYLEEVSIVPTRLLPGDTHESGDKDINILAERPELVKVAGINDGSDSINEISALAKAAEGIYDLQGRKLAAPVKGLNIINGVKTFVK